MGVERLDRLGTGMSHHGEAIIVVRPPPRHAEGEIPQGWMAGRGKAIAAGANECLERLRAAGREWNQAGRLGHGCDLAIALRRRRRDLGRLWCRLQNGVGIGAAKAKGADTRQASSTVGPRRQLRLHPQGELIEGDVRVGLIEVEIRRDGTMFECQGCLDEPRHPSSTFEMANVRFDSAEHAGAVGRAVLAEHSGQSSHLDRIAESGAGAVRLDVLDLGGLDSGVLAGFVKDRFLSMAVWSRQTIGAAILVDRGAADDSVNGVAVSLGLGQRLEDHHAGALAADVAVGPGVECLAPPIRRHEPGLGEVHRQARGEDEVDAGCESHRTFAAAQAAAGEVNRDQRRGAGSIDGHARSVQVEQVRKTVGSDAQRVTRSGIGVAHLRIAELHDAVFVGAYADEDAGAAAGDPLRRQSCILERFPHHLEQQPLLRVHPHCLARGDREESRIELIDAIEEAAPAGVHLAGCRRIGIVKVIDVPP